MCAERSGHPDGAVPRRRGREPIPGVHLRSRRSGCDVRRTAGVRAGRPLLLSGRQRDSRRHGGIPVACDQRAQHASAGLPEHLQRRHLRNDYNSFYIQGIYDLGVTAGCGDGTNYCPNVPVTRAQMSALVWRGQNGDEPPPSCSGVFDDVPCPSLYADYIEALFNEGVVVGCGNNNFCPHSPSATVRWPSSWPRPSASRCFCPRLLSASNHGRGSRRARFFWGGPSPGLDTRVFHPLAPLRPEPSPTFGRSSELCC